MGAIRSFPKLSDNMPLSQEDLDLLSKNGSYEYEISLIGRKLTEEELKDKKNINLNDYGKLIFLKELNSETKRDSG